MFLKEKNKPSQNSSHKLNTYNSNNNKYYNRKKKTYNKKNSYQNNNNQYNTNKNWKKYWKEKENDKNFINTPKKNKKNNLNKNTIFMKYESEDTLLNMDYCTTSNSSTHEESTISNTEEIFEKFPEKKNSENLSTRNKKNKNIKIKKKQRKMSSSSKNLDFKGIEKVQLILSPPSSTDLINTINNNTNTTNPNNTNINNNTIIKSTSTNTEPYNKFNSVNQELNMAPTVNSILENTEILNVNVKISKDKNAIFKLRRFDDLFLTVKLFCEINKIEEKMMKPIITQALSTLNNIYKIYNTQLDKKNINILRLLKTFNNDI